MFGEGFGCISVAVGHISDKAIERANKLSKVFRKRKYWDEKDPDILEFVKMIHPTRGVVSLHDWSGISQ
jgi:hypothetical protein